MTVDEEWSQLTLSIANDPQSFSHWEALLDYVSKDLSKVSTPSQIEEFRLSYDQFLNKFPLMEQYWVNYAQLEWKMGHTDESLMVYERALGFLPFSNLIWLHYLELMNLVQLDYNKLCDIYREAELKIGFHYHSYEFWKNYLELEESHNGKSLYWFNLLKKIVELPIYNFAYFFGLLFQEIDDIGPDNLLKLVSENELMKKLKIDVKGLDLKRINYRDLKAKLKKTYTDAYITTQFKSFELYEFEQGVKLEYFVPELYKSYQELVNWDQYLSFMELNGKDLQVAQLYHRALVPSASYPNLWLKFADYYIHKNRINDAKNLLYKSLVCLSDSNLVPVQLKLIKLELQQKNYLKARDLTLAALSKNAENVELLLQLINIERLMGDEAHIHEFAVALINRQPADLSMTLLRAMNAHLDLDITQFKDRLSHKEDFWILYLTSLLTTSSSEQVMGVFEEAMKTPGLPTDKLSKWYEDHLLLSSESLRTHFLNSSRRLLHSEPRVS
jgi:pre-mRNA-processing factor 39